MIMIDKDIVKSIEEGVIFPLTDMTLIEFDDIKGCDGDIELNITINFKDGDTEICLT